MSAPLIQRGAGASPASTSGAVQFNNAGAFGGNATNFAWDSTNQVLKMRASGTFDHGAAGLVVGVDEALFLAGMLLLYGSFDTDTPEIRRRVFRGTVAAPTAVQAEDFISYERSDGYTGAIFQTAVTVATQVDAALGAWTPGRWSVLTAPAGGSGAIERLRVDSLGGIRIVEEFANGADPAAPALGFRLYSVKTAGGKEQAAIRFATGAPIIIATEP